MMKSKALFFPLASCLMASSVSGITLSSGGIRYQLSPDHGNLQEASEDGPAFISESFDCYRLLSADAVVEGLESDDVVVEENSGPNEDRVTFKCRNEELGLALDKTYSIDREHGWLFKKVEVRADAGVGGMLLFESGVEVPPEWWNGAMLWEPVWHTPISPFKPAREIKEFTNLAPRNGCRSFIALYQPRKNTCILHFRWGGEEFEHFDVVGERENFGKRVWPRRWLLGSQERFVGGPHDRIFTTQMVYGLHEGTAQHALMTYAALPEYRELFVDHLEGSPAWVDDTYIDEHWDVSALRHGYDQLLKDVLEKKIYFGNIMTTLWGAFPHELYIVRPEDREPDSPDDPEKNMKHLRLMQGLSPRIKAGYYTHFGSVSTKNGSTLSKLAKEQGWISHRRDGTPSMHRTDYNMENEKTAVDMTRFEPGFREFYQRRFRELFEHNGVDLIYMDTAVRPGSYEYDWKEFRAPAARDVIDMYNGFLATAQEFGGTVTMNMPIPTGNTSGFTELPWFQAYENDWRRLAGRAALFQALNPVARRLYLAGYIMPSGKPTDPSIRLHLNCMRMYAMGLGMLDVKPVEYKRDLYIQGAPYIQAGYEIRSRILANAAISPDWFKMHEIEVEAYAWKMTETYGLVTVMNHEPYPVKQTVAFDTKPLGLRRGRPAFVWQHEMPDPRMVDYDGVTMESPIRGLASRRLILVKKSVPKRMTLDLELPGDNPVEIAITHSPAVITSVDDKPCQYWLPSAYGVAVSGVAASGTLSVTVENVGESADILIVLQDKFGDSPTVKQRKWSKSHETGVALGYEPIEFSVLRIDDNKFISCEVGPGQTEITIN
jgi:hypothetical protein